MAISGPIAPYSNVPIEPQFYAPRQYFISSITLGKTTIVTTTEDHDYSIGQQCRLIIPPQSGCRQLNESYGYVISVPASNQVVLDIYSSGGDSFISSSSGTQPQILPIGDINSGQINTNGINSNLSFINGSFINISPE